jgi:hypothetical protein
MAFAVRFSRGSGAVVSQASSRWLQRPELQLCLHDASQVSSTELASIFMSNEDASHAAGTRAIISANTIRPQP